MPPSASVSANTVPDQPSSVIVLNTVSSAEWISSKLVKPPSGLPNTKHLSGAQQRPVGGAAYRSGTYVSCRDGNISPFSHSPPLSS